MKYLDPGYAKRLKVYLYNQCPGITFASLIKSITRKVLSSVVVIELKMCAYLVVLLVK